MKVFVLDVKKNTTVEFTVENKDSLLHFPYRFSRYKVLYFCTSCSSQVESYARTFLGKKHFGLCASCSIGLEWKGETYRNNKISSLKNTLKDPKKRKHKSLLNYKRWSDPEYKKKMKLKFNSEEYREKQRLGKSKSGETQLQSLFERKLARSFFKSFNCDSAAEYAYTLFLDKKNIQWEKCKVKITFFSKLKNRIATYTPDFIIYKNNKITFVEVKGCYSSEFNDLPKVRQANSLNKSALLEKLEVLKEFCKQKGYEHELVTQDDLEFNKIYRQVLRKKIWKKNT